MFASANLPVFGGGVEALMTQVVLQEPEAVSRIIYLYCVYGERIPQSVGADIVHPASFGVS